MQETGQPPRHQSPARLLWPEQVRATAQADDPEYGQDFTEADWERITERLEVLARLLWQFSVRQVAEEARQTGEAKGDDKSTPPAAGCRQERNQSAGQ